ncbi:zinc finger BED domain-containing protein DAYSLEEPER-like isoform X2 [Hibiscus syriacus]|uniref:zinc finger BED domain-containing protein DAYSLEEPER-like isoform X2 n=1 Tax=Hibiscus syriacus TaxID=106335 RepID=UPI0019234213|nr:zinc finger BED domain-containing protein DAYSLEEPER-like isoform X2 [Hibiscus syriacus]
MFLTGQFVDTEWNLHRCLLNVVTVPFPDSDGALQQTVVSCLSEWHLENRLFTLTLDQSFSNENINESLRALFSGRNPYVLHGQLLIGNCFARVISLLAREALWSVGATVNKIRESAKFVKSSDTHEETFFHLKEQLKEPSTKDIFIDDQTKWNTTYDMLVAACELKQVFLCLETSFLDYNIAPSMDDWKQIEILCTYLKLFFDAVSILTAQTYPTASAFYHEVSKVQLELTHASMSNDPFISNLTKPLKEKFDRYWSDCFLVLAIAVVMDPRFKMKLVEFSFSRIYGDDAGMWIKIVDDGIHELYHEYTIHEVPPRETFVEERNESGIPEDNGSIIPKTELPENGFLQEGLSEEGYLQEGPSQEVACHEVPHQEVACHEMPHQEVTCHEMPHQEVASQEAPSSDPLISIGDGLSDFEVYISGISVSQQTRSELDQYLEESLLPREHDFNILSWWKLNKKKYPILWRMASDILSIPFSTVGSDFVFDTDRKKMDNYHSSLHPVTLEALICAKDWLQYGGVSQSSE